MSSEHYENIYHFILRIGIQRKIYWGIAFLQNEFYDNFDIKIGSRCSWSSFPRLRRQWSG